MSNKTITNIDTGHVVLERVANGDELLTAAGAATFLSGTILARDTDTGKLVPYVKEGSTNGNGVPHSVLTYEVAATGPGDVAVRPLLAGKVNRNRLVIHADADASNVDSVEVDGLRSMHIIAEDVSQLGRYDNPQGEDEDS